MGETIKMCNQVVVVFIINCNGKEIKDVQSEIQIQ